MTDSGEYKNVYNTQVIPYSGDLYTIETYGDSTQRMEVTAGHPILSVKRLKKRDRNKQWKKSWMIPKYLNKLDYLTIPINKTIISNSTRKYSITHGVGRHKPKKYEINVPLSKDFFRLIGYYLAEGSVSGNEGDHYVNFSFNENERAYIEDVKQLLKTVFGYEKAIETQTPNNHGTNVVVSSVDLAQVFKEFGKGAPNKVIPHWAMLEDPEKQKQLLSSLFHGDGNFYSKQHKSGYKETFRISTTSEKLARQAREILLRVKIPAFLNKQKRVSPRKPMYTVGVTGEYMSRFGEMVGIPVSNKMNGKNRASMFYIDDDFLYVPIKRITKKEVRDIPVYDISVEDLHTYVAAGVTVHNCSAPQYSANSLHAGCVEIFVKKNARMRYSSVENWSKNTYNLNTKRAMVDENSLMEWVSAQTGSGVTMLYPCSVLKGEGAKADHISIAVAGKNQFQDTGAKVYHLAPRTTSIIRAKSISKDGGVNTFRGHVKVNKSADECKVSVKCDALQMDLLSVSNTYPFMKILNSQTDVAHEATVGKIDSSQLFYLMSRGLDEEQAMQLIVQGFIENIVKELPLEYAVELNRLIALEMESHSA
ncbi:MAG: hypothetical protein FJY86_03385 [Candidatus Diapherotrites archaeon]|uniref:DOD-type homing endonuclease domain-containing protein n=1 Tax=Candidatus Iainarchaeum sp. TaxID=3101447 RepID=A0A8T4C732_9ARCH|nr:hypothetical protein [Candidatus Diapherotrites archaeon]